MAKTEQSDSPSMVLEQASKIVWGTKTQVILDKREDRWLIYLRGDFGLEYAARLKALLVDGLGSGKQLNLDLAGVSEVDITVMQLILAAQKESIKPDQCIVTEVSEVADRQARHAGLNHFPGVAKQS